MKPRVTVITIGVDDLERSLAFYRDGLGFPTQGIIGTEFEHGAVVFIDLQPGLKLALWPLASIAHDTGIDRGAPNATGLVADQPHYLGEPGFAPGASVRVGINPAQARLLSA
jgi:hypothetical protein